MSFLIKPTLRIAPHRTGALNDLSEMEISYMLTFKPNATHLDDPTKVDHCWSFNVDGNLHSIWSYRDSHKQRCWSVYGLDVVFETVFGDHYIPMKKVTAQGQT